MTMPTSGGNEISNDAFLHEFAWYVPLGQFARAETNDVNAWFVAADAAAVREQAKLQRLQKRLLHIALVSIIALASSAIVIGNPVPQLLCPVVVFLMIVYLDKLRQSAVIFRFTALRLLAETLRVVIAVSGKPGLRDYVLRQRGRNTHAVLHLTSVACGAVKEQPSGTMLLNWSEWVESQLSYFQEASPREKWRSTRGKYLFNASFCSIAIIAMMAGIWAFMDPSIIGGKGFNGLLTLVAAVGSIGLALINYVRERKAFDQSIDYAHMNRIFQNFHQLGPSNSRSVDEEEALVSASLDENGRWAIRMAGHFAERPGAT